MSIEYASVLDAARPPGGYQFSVGIWLTHDLSASAVNAHLLPALAAAGGDSGLNNLTTVGDLNPQCLTIVAAGDRVTWDTSLSDRARVIRVAERRAHAKVAVLVFWRVDESVPGTKTALARVRTIITSANLTPGGMLHNREVVAVEDVSSMSKPRSILPDVIKAMARLSRDTDGGVPQELQPFVRRLRREVKRAVGEVPSSHQFFDSFTKSCDFLDVLGEGPWAEVSLVSPAFAGDDTRVGDLIGQRLAPRAAVRLVVGDDIDGTVHVPKRLITRLSRATGAGGVEVYRTSRHDPDVRHERVLHAKAFIATDLRGRTLAMIGSVNLTEPALTGVNREAVVVVPWDQPLAETLEDLDATKVDGPFDGTGKGADFSAVQMPEVLSLTFIPDDGQDAGCAWIYGRLEGTTLQAGDQLVLTFRGQDFRFRLGEPIRLPNGKYQLRLERADGTSIAVAVTLQAPPGYWSDAFPDDLREFRDPLLARLRADISKMNRPSRSSREAHKSVHMDHGFSLPLDTRLMILTKYRDQLRGIPDEWLGSHLQRMFPDPDEFTVARAVVASLGSPPLHGDPLLQALDRVLRAAPMRRD